MILVGAILMVIGFLLKIAILWTIGIVALVVGLILLAWSHFRTMPTTTGRRRHYW